MRARFISIFWLLAVPAVPRLVSSAEIDVTAWGLGTGVTIGSGTIADGTTTVMNGLQAEYFASLQNSTAFSSISASWDSQGFQFLVEGEHACQGGDFVWCDSSGNIFFTPQADSVFTAAGMYDYALAPGFRFARLGVTVASNELGGAVLNDFFSRSTLTDPPVGRIDYQSQPLLLQGGVAYSLAYSLELLAATGSPTVLSTGEGFIQLSIVPVPCPATGAMLILGAALLPRRH